MAGSTSTLRTAGYVTDSVGTGFPVEIDSNVKVRSVDDLLVNMKDMSTDFLKLIGGPTQFTFRNTKREWVEDDMWNRRITGCTLAHAATTLELNADISHRFPIGTLFLNTRTGELARVVTITDINTVEVVRDVATAAHTGDAAWLATDEVKVAGSAMAANAAWNFRAGGIFTMPYNYAQVMTDAIEVTFDRMETDLYGLQGTDLDYLAANCVGENFVKMEGTLLDGQRFSGDDATKPALAGGVKFYVTAANGAQVSDLSGVALTRKDLDDKLQALLYAVGPEKMARTVLTCAWGKRKISSWFSSAERLSAGASVGGVAIDRINTDFGPIEFLLHTALDQNEILLLNRDMIKMGCHGNLGRPKLLVPAGISTSGPYVQRFYYASVTVQCKGVQGMGRIYNFSTST